MYLEEIEDPAITLGICEQLLSKQMQIPNALFIMHFMITDLDAYLKPFRKRELLRQRLGANAVLCIPESHRRPYESLTSQPLLLLEQLLIDMKVEWAGKVFEDLQTELSANKNYDESLRREISGEAFDKLLVWYASKALEFNVVTFKERGRYKLALHGLHHMNDNKFILLFVIFYPRMQDDHNCTCQLLALFLSQLTLGYNWSIRRAAER